MGKGETQSQSVEEYKGLRNRFEAARDETEAAFTTSQRAVDSMQAILNGMQVKYNELIGTIEARRVNPSEEKPNR
ncbi:MAG: hypothetical protein M3P33_01550 [bacterium]|nr:hypothetical protein [bacterium]